MCDSSSSLHFLFPCSFSGTVEGTDIINTPLEPLWPADVFFGGFVDIAPHFGGEIPPKPQFWGHESASSSQTGKILKVSCYRKYCIDFNEILHNYRDHQELVGGLNRRPTNPRWRTAAILEKKTVKSLYLCNRLTDFDKIWYSDAHWSLTAKLSLKFPFFENPKWRRPPSWKITKIAISP